MRSQRSTAIITGIKGQDGTLLRNRLEQRNYNLIGTSRLPGHSACIKLDGSNCENDISSLTDAIKYYQPNLLFHLASDNKSLSDANSYCEEEPYRSNILLTELILDSVLSFSPSTHVVLIGSSQQFNLDSTQVIRHSPRKIQRITMDGQKA